MHLQLTEGVSPVLEAEEADSLNIKVWLRNNNPPCSIFIKYLDTFKADLTIYTSQEIRAPSETAHHGSYHNVSTIVT